MTAVYDYKAQRWVEGPDAVTLQIQQLREDLALLQGIGGSAYAEFIGADRASLIADCASQLLRLQRAQP